VEANPKSTQGRRCAEEAATERFVKTIRGVVLEEKDPKKRAREKQSGASCPCENKEEVVREWTFSQQASKKRGEKNNLRRIRFVEKQVHEKLPGGKNI